MKISFDLDSTLIPGEKTFATERMTWLQQFVGIEPIRRGTVALMKKLRAEGHLVCIYTTSLRPSFSIRLAFWTYGVGLDEIINQKRHDRKLGEKRMMSSKYPPAFRIDLHIDDLPGVALEGKKFGFRTIILDEKNSDWTSLILSVLDATS